MKVHVNDDSDLDALPRERLSEGLARHAFTVDQMYRMVETGVLDEDLRIELIDGDLIPMSPKGNHHEVLKSRLSVYFARTMPADIMFVTETSFRLGLRTLLEPDFVFYPEQQPLSTLSGPNALLVIEVADSSLWYDRGRKARIYASFGVRELWVINAVQLTADVFRDPEDSEYRGESKKGPGTRIESSLIPGLNVTLDTLTLR